MKKIKLEPGIPFQNKLIIDLIDMERETPKKRCSITAEYARSDVEDLKNRGLSFDEAMAHYKEWLRQIIRRHLLDEPEYVGGYDEVMNIIEEHVKQYYQK